MKKKSVKHYAKHTKSAAQELSEGLVPYGKRKTQRYNSANYAKVISYILKSEDAETEMMVAAATSK
ncbi:MAG TPA: hypothetical protein VIM75_13265 [Ohtaekwangia sp.]|uniref:hypothetical protein n=1 Tax=Ohtaekwangia sp. TaxID=2066019 RepID=UPI002F945C36